MKTLFKSKNTKTHYPANVGDAALTLIQEDLRHLRERMKHNDTPPKQNHFEKKSLRNKLRDKMVAGFFSSFLAVIFVTTLLITFKVYAAPVNADTQALSPKTNIELTRAIRDELYRDDTLSQNAKNIKIISLKNQVVLRGPVNTPEEKDKIQGIVEGVIRDQAAYSDLKNEIEVTGVSK